MPPEDLFTGLKYLYSDSGSSLLTALLKLRSMVHAVFVTYYSRDKSVYGITP